jgi:chloride channel 3/4/5
MQRLLSLLEPAENALTQSHNFSTIDWNADLARERHRKREQSKITGFKGLYITIWELFIDMILLFIIGGLLGLVAGFIDVTEMWVVDVRRGFCAAGFYLNRKFCCVDESRCDGVDWYRWSDGFFGHIGGFLIYTLFALLFATSSATLVRAFAPFAAGSGIPEIKTILGGFVIKNFLGVQTLVMKTLGVVLAVGSGLCVGKEGPLVHIACALTKNISHLTRKYRLNTANTRELLSAACAGGVSVAFGAPVGGVLFSLEEVSFYFPHKTMFRSFFLAMISALSLQFINPFRTGKVVLFQVVVEQDWKFFELIGFAVLGILGGLYGSFFIKMVLFY